MIQLMINGKTQRIEQGSLLAVLRHLSLTEKHLAIAVNEHFVPQSAYADTQLFDGDRIEVLVPMQGG
ncbi:MAG: sulfur carrier protein ThiS [Cellvibrionaceae bacterium]|nr:sulfur carrier protein ThiS [Cellvibrionaceae bacterium]